MKQVLMLAAGGLSIMGVAMAAPMAQVIDFDDITMAGTPVSTQYQSQGVTFSALEDGVAFTPETTGENTSAFGAPGAQVLTNCDVGAATGICGERFDELLLSFSGPASDVSFDIVTYGSQDVTLEAYDIGGNLLETIVATGADNDYVNYAFAALNIALIRGLQPNDGWAWAMDDLSFMIDLGDPVPLPAALPLFAAGLAGLGFMRRRRA